MSPTPDTLRAKLRERLVDELVRLRETRVAEEVAAGPGPVDGPPRAHPTAAEAADVVEANLDTMADELAARVAETVAVLVEEKLRPAVMERERLTSEWPLSASKPLLAGPAWQAFHELHAKVLRNVPFRFEGADPEGFDVTRVRRAGPLTFTASTYTVQPEETWPGEVAPLDAARWAQAALERHDKGSGAGLAEAAKDTNLRVFFVELVDPKTPDAPLYIPAHAFGLVYLAVRQVEEDAKRRIVPFSANKNGRVALLVMSAGADPRNWEDSVDGNGGRLALVWKGGKDPVQLSLEWTQDLGGAALQGILKGLHEDGIRDWLILHRLTDEQGRDGGCTWTWNEHKARSVYARRLKQKNATEKELQHDVSERLRWLARSELRLYQDVPRVKGQKPTRRWVRVGDHGLIDIPAGVDSFDGMEAARVNFNAAIYGGASKDGGNCYGLVSEEALMLSGKALRVAALLACQRWYAADKTGGELVWTARHLWEVSTLRGGDPAPKTRQRAGEALVRLLDTLGDVGELGNWEQLDPGEVTPETRFRLVPPSWWRVQAVHRVPRVLPALTAGVPRTGAELKAWRERAGLSQREAAGRLGVPQPLVSREEAKGDGTLSGRLLEVLRRTLAA